MASQFLCVSHPLNWLLFYLPKELVKVVSEGPGNGTNPSWSRRKGAKPHICLQIQN